MRCTRIFSKKLFYKVALIILALMIWQLPAWAGQNPIIVMTRNLFIGAEIQSLAGAPDLPSFVLGVQEALAQMASNNFPERAEALAAVIAEKEPHLVALQEVYDLTINGGNLFPPFRNYLDDLLDALDAQGADYYVAAVVNNLDLPLEVSAGIEIGVLDRDVILARDDVVADALDISSFCPSRESADGCIYQVIAVAEDTPIGDIPFPRGFVAVNAVVDGFEFIFIDTHLEVRNPDPTNAASPLVQRYQAAELVSFINGFTLDGKRVILAGDINSSPEDSGAIWGPYPPYVMYPPYKQIEDAGNVDAWTLRPGKPRGYTCCFEEDLREPADLYERIDVIFSNVEPYRVKANVVGNSESDRTFTGLWPSDHAGVVARLFFEPFPMPKKPFKARRRR